MATTTTRKEPDGLVTRLAGIMNDLPNVAPEGKNEHFKYKFLTNTQINGLLRPRLASANIMVIPVEVTELEPIEMTTQRGGRSLLTRMKVRFSLVCGYTGETITGEVIGYGDDSGDKGANKAYTAALKNFLVKIFLIGGEADLEDDSEADQRAKARESGSTGRDVVIGSTIKVDVAKGGRAKNITETQMNQIGRFMTDLMMTPEAFVKFAKLTFPDVEVNEDFKAIKEWLEGLSADDAGKLLQAFDSWSSMEDEAKVVE